MKTPALIALAGLLAACSTAPAPTARLDGEVFYLQRIALPPAATLSVSLQDVSRADAAAIVLARQSGQVKGQVPLAFSLDYPVSQVRPGHRYTVSARIESDGRLLFINTEPYSVNLDGRDPQPLRIKVNQVHP